MKKTTILCLDLSSSTGIAVLEYSKSQKVPKLVEYGSTKCAIEDFNVTAKDIDDITEWQGSIDALIGDGRCAVVACKDSVYGMSRMWEIISSERSQHIYVFRQINDAVTWLDNTPKEE